MAASYVKMMKDFRAGRPYAAAAVEVPNPLSVDTRYRRHKSLQKDLTRYYEACRQESSARRFRSEARRKAYCAGVAWKRLEMAGRYPDYPGFTLPTGRGAPMAKKKRTRRAAASAATNENPRRRKRRGRARTAAASAAAAANPRRRRGRRTTTSRRRRTSARRTREPRTIVREIIREVPTAAPAASANPRRRRRRRRSTSKESTAMAMSKENPRRRRRRRTGGRRRARETVTENPRRRRRVRRSSARRHRARTSALESALVKALENPRRRRRGRARRRMRETVAENPRRRRRRSHRRMREAAENPRRRRRRGGGRRRRSHFSPKYGRESMALAQYGQSNPLSWGELALAFVSGGVGYVLTEVVDRWIASHPTADEGRYVIKNGTQVTAKPSIVQIAVQAGMTAAPLVISGFVRNGMVKSVLHGLGLGAGTYLVADLVRHYLLVKFLGDKDMGQRLYAPEIVADNAIDNTPNGRDAQTSNPAGPPAALVIGGLRGAPGFGRPAAAPAAALPYGLGACASAAYPFRDGRYGQPVPMTPVVTAMPAEPPVMKPVPGPELPPPIPGCSCPPGVEWVGEPGCKFPVPVAHCGNPCLSPAEVLNVFQAAMRECRVHGGGAMGYGAPPSVPPASSVAPANGNSRVRGLEDINPFRLFSGTGTDDR